MGSNGGEESMISGSNTAICSEATVQIKIKTLDSQTYTLQVDKCVPVPALKEQIATVTGILSDQQRLICRGKVLKDDQLLSAYHVEDGHTLHLVVREPIPPPSESFPDNPATDPTSSADQSHGHQMGPGVLVGSFNISELGDGTFQDLGRIVSAVLGSFGVAEFGSSGEGVDPQAPNLERVSRTTGPGGSTNSGRQQPNQTGTRSGFPHQAAFSLDPMHPPVIPDSLTTLTQYLSHMRQEFSANAGDQTNPSQDLVSDGQNSDAASGSAARRGGLPTPASLAEVMRSTRQFLNEQAGECLSQLTRQIEDHASMTDTMARMRIQSNAMRTGSLLQNLGALLLELGRTTMTLQIGQTPADAVVNAGPAVFISTSGPNPIMVQPLPFQPGASFGTIPVGTAQPGSGPGLSSGSVGASGFLPRSIDIRIRTGSVMASSAANPREPTAGQPVGQSQTNPAAPAGENFANQATAGPTGGQSAVRRSEVRVIPLRTVLTAVPAHGGPTPSNPSRGSMGLFYPVISRDTTSGNVNITRGQASGQPTPNGVDTAQQSMPTAVAQEPSTQVPRADVSHGQLDQFFRILAGVDPISANGNVGAARAANNSQEIAPSPAGEEGTFLSNLLRQIIPAISEHTTQTSNSSVDGDNVMEDRTAQNSSVQAQENSDRGTTSRRRNAPQSPESSKRQKREQ